MYHLVYQAGIANVFRCDTWPNVSRVFQGDFRGAELIVRVLLMADEHVEVWNCNRAGDIGLCPNLWVQGIADAPFCDAMNPPDGCLV